jgi:hypothetical protein
MTRRFCAHSTILASGAAATLIALSAIGADGPATAKPKLGYKDTPMLPGGRWHVHDGDRPLPPIVTPGSASTQDKAGTAPADAVVLFDGKDSSLSHWQKEGGGAPGWIFENGEIVIKPHTGALASKDEFGDCQLHLEFASPNPPKGSDQGRGNSGLLMFGKYEVQILDSYQNLTYADGQAAAIYGQFPPLVNASRPPGQWQTYDVVFIAPRFKTDGSLESPARATVFHNGVLVHHDRTLIGPMKFRGIGAYKAHGPKGPIVLQDHSNPVRFRNIWVRPLASLEN